MGLSITYWLELIPVKTCNRPELIDANISGGVKQSYSNNEEIQYVCTYSQEVHKAKCEEGVWTGIKNCSGMERLYRFLQFKHENNLSWGCWRWP